MPPSPLYCSQTSYSHFLLFAYINNTTSSASINFLINANYSSPKRFTQAQSTYEKQLASLSSNPSPTPSCSIGCP